MKIVSLADAKNGLSGLVDEAQEGRILVTRYGRPAAIVIGVGDYDMESLLTASDPAFWQMIAERRREPTIAWEDIQKEHGLDAKPTTKPRRTKAPAARRAKAAPSRKAAR
jgi:prevent-host-death family protein